MKNIDLLKINKINFDKFNCIICGKEFNRRIEGIKNKSYKKNLRPYRCITCSTKCAVMYNRMPLNKRNLLKIQGGIKKMENTEVMLTEDNILTTFEYEQNGKEIFGIALLTEEKYNPSAKKGTDEEYYYEQKFTKFFKSKENLLLFEEGLKILDKAIINEFELEEKD